jgi:hypothetical protein
MEPKKPVAQIFTADGEGGMCAITDHRFDAGEWPISFVVEAKEAVQWMAHLSAEREARGWHSSGLSQIDAAENSGSLSVHTATGATPLTLEIVWEKERDKSLRIRARTSGSPTLSVEVARDFFSAVDVRRQRGTTLRERRRAWLTYNMLPWRGELWLDGDLRLGPPAKYPPTLYGPQVVVIDAMVEGIGFQGVTDQFQRRLTELKIFLCAVLGSHFEIEQWREGWSYEADERGVIIDCRVAHLGYAEVTPEPGFPLAGSAPPIPRRAIHRPGIGKVGVTIGITPDMTERWVPEDIENLWGDFCALTADKRDHFMKAGNAYLIAQTMWPAQRTAYASFLVVACEALKPQGRRFHGTNIYDVVESLGGAGEGKLLRSLDVATQKVRSGHFHRGELLAGELRPLLISDPFLDPSFDSMLRTLNTLTRVCLIEWLRCKGEYKVVHIPRDTPQRSWNVFANDLFGRLRAFIRK